MTADQKTDTASEHDGSHYLRPLKPFNYPIGTVVRGHHDAWHYHGPVTACPHPYAIVIGGRRVPAATVTDAVFEEYGLELDYEDDAPA